MDNNIIMMANINPRAEDLCESVQALSYTAIARDINIMSNTSRLSLRVVSKQKLEIKKEVCENRFEGNKID